MRLEKKRILKEDGRYLLFYHSAATATADQSQAFTAVEAEAETVMATKSGAKKGAAQNGAVEQERADV